MKFLYQKMFIALAFLGFSTSALAHTWIFTNLTEKPIVIEFKLRWWGYTYYDIVNPGENSTRFDWPVGSLKVGFCVKTFLIGQLEPHHLEALFGDTQLPSSAEIAQACVENNTRDILARVGKRDLPIRWISGEKWGTFDKATRDAMNALTAATTAVAGEAANLALAAGAEVATGGTTAGAAGTVTKKLNLGAIFKTLNSIPGSIMTLAEKSRCTSRHFDIIKDMDTDSLVAVTKE